MTDITVEHIDHTGDAGLRITAGSLTDLLTVCAHQMVRLVCPEGRIRRTLARPVWVEGADLVELFINWLSEVNSLMAIHHEIYDVVTIDLLSDPDDPPLHLKGTAQGEPIDPDRHQIALEIKAVTFHAAYVRQTDTAWECQVIFDL
jgi:SHS2 domain-containing protein